MRIWEFQVNGLHQFIGYFWKYFRAPLINFIRGPAKSSSQACIYGLIVWRLEWFTWENQSPHICKQCLWWSGVPRWEMSHFPTPRSLGHQVGHTHWVTESLSQGGTLIARALADNCRGGALTEPLSHDSLQMTSPSSGHSPSSGGLMFISWDLNSRGIKTSPSLSLSLSLSLIDTQQTGTSGG